MTQKEVVKNTKFNLDNSYLKLSDIFFTIQDPSSVPSPKLVALNYSLINSLGLDSKFLQSNDGVEILAGNKLPEGAIPFAQAYAGHQFGHFTMLGDGRAVLIGEHITPIGERLDIQLKGSGRTPYSRGGDGKAALGPMLREYIISESMAALGIPTTRSLVVVTTGEKIIREDYLPGAILTRVASSHIRVGTFQYGSRFGNIHELKELSDYTINRHYPYIADEENKYLAFLKEVIKKQAELIAKWQLVGFIHGVMNTDNMTISGETIDYGPCAFMDVYDPETVFSSIDVQGRYAYGNQPKLAAWDLARFAETLIPLIHTNQDEAVDLAQNAISEFANTYEENWLSGMRSKLGIFNEEDEDKSLIDNLLSMMHKYGADYTNTFVSLTIDKKDGIAMFSTSEFSKWNELWQERLTRQSETKESVKQLMQSSNPYIIPRNHRVEEALDAAVKNEDYGVMDRLLDALSKPFAYSKEQDEYSTLPEPSNRSYRTFCGT
ncbi:protein adenylyltransferase SelO [Clostridium tertium]|uniref:protein adenylyltransferase SelO n=1 Tax=Clostridium tertium TaxID=1559 RepID=UPI00232FB581|nr:YdiU family protein [Clostridium tertium]MDB1939836.1 YdiU family protein [Clostridium tertium]